MPDLIVITGFPGGPYRLEITDTFAGPWFTAAEMCACELGGHWHECADAPTWQCLIHDLLTRFLEGVTS